METTDRVFAFLRDVFPVLVVLLVGGAGVFAFLAILGFTHTKAQMILEFYREVERQLAKEEALQKQGAETTHLEKFQELHGALKEMLVRERVIRPPAPPGPPPPQR